MKSDLSFRTVFVWIPLLFSSAALLLAVLVFAETRGLRRLQDQGRTASARISQEEFTRIQELYSTAKGRFQVGQTSQTDALFFERIYNRARMLHGEIGADELQRLNQAIEAQLAVFFRSNIVWALRARLR